MKTNINGTEVDGICINDAVIERLKDYQKDQIGENGLSRDLWFIAEAIIFLGAKYWEFEPVDRDKSSDLICKLSLVSQRLESFS
ncbi:MAG: hypothetical protein M1445_11650 [Bacteroidetes bacterium]|nr:hypothetical protein [Bacteroidota bacterium]MCL6101606.1 hypothetical protein [Bacteroidota bacterium]